MHLEIKKEESEKYYEHEMTPQLCWKGKQNKDVPQIEGLTKVPASTAIVRTYIPSNHAGSLKSSIEKTAFNSGEETNLKRGAEGALEYFLPTGYITCHIYRVRTGKGRKNDKLKEY